jgi:hypothetical protein
MTPQERPIDRFVPRDDAAVVLRWGYFMTSRTAKLVITPRFVTLSLRAKRGNP